MPTYPIWTLYSHGHCRRGKYGTEKKRYRLIHHHAGSKTHMYLWHLYPDSLPQWNWRWLPGNLPVRLWPNPALLSLSKVTASCVFRSCWEQVSSDPPYIIEGRFWPIQHLLDLVIPQRGIVMNCWKSWLFVSLTEKQIKLLQCHLMTSTCTIDNYILCNLKYLTKATLKGTTSFSPIFTGCEIFTL